MNRYFRVPMEAVHAIHKLGCTPETLAGFVVLNRHATGRNYRYTAAGARAIRDLCGVSDFRSKRVLQELLALRFGEHGNLFLIEDTGQHIANAKKYCLGPWDGMHAYLPWLFVQGKPSPLSRLVNADDEPETIRDALLMLLHVYANVDYEGFLGVDPETFVFTRWTGEGMAPAGDDEIELGYAGQYNGLQFWMMAENDETRFSTYNAAQQLFPDSVDREFAMQRFWAAHGLLVDLGMLCRVAIVETAGGNYPLWVFSPAYREALARNGIPGDFGDTTSRAAGNADFDPDCILIRAATGDDREQQGTGVFFAVTTSRRMPRVRTIYAPMFHAPTPLNLEGLELVRTRTLELQEKLTTKRKGLSAVA